MALMPWTAIEWEAVATYGMKKIEVFILHCNADASIVPQYLIAMEISGTCA